MPQPMSTPTAATITAPLVGMTDPTVAPMPTWASGMSATWPATIDSRAVFSAWRIVPGSTSVAQEMSLSFRVVGMVRSPFDGHEVFRAFLGVYLAHEPEARPFQRPPRPDVLRPPGARHRPVGVEPEHDVAHERSDQRGTQAATVVGGVADQVVEPAARPVDTHRRGASVYAWSDAKAYVWNHATSRPSTTANHCSSGSLPSILGGPPRWPRTTGRRRRHRCTSGSQSHRCSNGRSSSVRRRKVTSVGLP